MQLIAPLNTMKNKWGVTGSFESFDFVDFIYDQNLDEKTVSTLFICLFNHLKKRGVASLRWYYLDANSKSYSILCELIERKIIEIKNIIDLPNVKILLNKDNYEEHFKILNKHSRQNCRTAYNRMIRDDLKYSNSFMFSPFDKSGRKALIECLNVYRKRLLQHYHYSKIKCGVRCRFHYLSKSVKHNGFLSVFYINNEVAAFMEGFINKTKKEILIPRLAINDKYSFYSPGICLVNETLKKLYADGSYTCLNLLRGNEKYKYDMGGVEYKTISFDIILK